MDRRSRLVAAALLMAASATHAYVSPSPPAGFGGSPGAWTHTPPTAAQQLGSIMRGPGPTIPGGAVTNGAFRLGPGAARALAGGIARGLIPGVGLALGVAWLASKCIEKQGGQWVLTCGGSTPPQSTGFEYSPTNMPAPRPWFSTREAGCQAAWTYYTQARPSEVWGAVRVEGNGCLANRQTPTVVNDVNISNLEQRADSCPVGWYKTDAGCVQTVPPQVLTPEQIEEEMAPQPLPQTLPPGFPYPLDPVLPFIFEPDTANPPNAQPLRVPQGNPVPIPNTNPQQYRQPVTRFTPAPTTEDPFRLDARPEDLISTSPTGMTSPQTVPTGTPDGEKPEQFDLCKEHPDIIACQVFKPDELDAKPLVNKEVPLALNAEGGFPTGGSCPQAKNVQLMGQTFSFSMQPLCDFALGIKPLLIGFAWLSAALVFLGVARREN